MPLTRLLQLSHPSPRFVTALPGTRPETPTAGLLAVLNRTRITYPKTNSFTASFLGVKFEDTSVHGSTRKKQWDERAEERAAEKEKRLAV